MHLHQNLALLIFFIIVILIGLLWYLIICISIRVNDVLHLFMCLFPTVFNEASVQFLGSFSNWITYFLTFTYR